MRVIISFISCCYAGNEANELSADATQISPDILAAAVQGHVIYGRLNQPHATRLAGPGPSQF